MSGEWTRPAWSRTALPCMLVLGACSCGGIAERTTPFETMTAVGNCTEQPLTLGQAEVTGSDLQVLWTGEGYAVAWIGPAGYEVRLVEDVDVVATSTRSEPIADEYSRPQLLNRSGRLELYYSRLEDAWRDVLDDELEITESGATSLGAPSFRAVLLDSNRFALLGGGKLAVDESLSEAPFFYPAALGYDGETLLASTVLGHGAWHFRATNLNGEHLQPVFDFEWPGYSGTGWAGGSALASSYETGRHAAVVAAGSTLTVLIEGAAPASTTLSADESDASMFWDGEEYVVLYADGAKANRNIGMLSVNATLPVLGDAVIVSAHSADERFPTAAAGPGEYGIAWVRGTEVVFTRCTGR